MINRAFILRIISFIMVAALVVVIIVSMSGDSVSSRSVEEVAAVLVPIFENDNTEESSERIFKKYYGFNAADYDGVVLYSPKSNMDAEELLIVKFRSEEQAEDLIAAIEERNESQMNIYDGYAPEQFALCRDAVIDHQGNFLLYVVHEDAADIDASYRAALK